MCLHKVKLFLFSLLIGFPCFIWSQTPDKQISFRELTVEDGLSQNSVVSIAQDSTGYMWFATQDGLNKYDGRAFKYFNKQFEDVTRPSFSRLGKVYVDKEDRLWIITKSGTLELYDASQNTFRNIETIDAVSTIFQDSKKNLFAGSYDNGLFKIEKEDFSTSQIFKPTDSNKTVYDWLELDGQLVIATSGSVFSLKNNDYVEIPIEEELKSNFSTLEKTSDKTIWLGSFGDGLFYKSPKEKEFKKFIGYKNQQLPQDLIIQDVLVDKRDRLWIATYGQGVYLIDFELEIIQHFLANKNNPYALHYNDILCLYEDFTGTIWFGTDGAGLSYYDEHLSKFNVLTNKQLPSNINVDVIRAIAVNNDEFWLGTSGKGLTKINSSTQDYKTYTKDNSTIASDRIMSLLYDDEALWIGHQGKGLDKLTKNGVFKSFSELSEMTIWGIVKKSEEQLWLCTRDNGLILFDESKGVLKHFQKENSDLQTNNIRTILQQNDTIIWIGTDDDGLYKLEQKSDRIARVRDIPDAIKTLFFEGDKLWLGTNGNGLKSLNVKTNKVETFTKELGLPNNVIYGILSDEDNNLWLSSNKGITKFKQVSNDSILIDNYRNYDGLQAFEFNTGAYFKDTKGNLYFGGLEGLNWFNPKRLTFNQTQPKTIISKVDVFNEAQNIIQNQTFRHNQNTFTFTFSGLHFSQPERNQYKYKLVNNDEDWIYSGNDNTAHYTNLPPNDYQFQVLSSNYDGVWDNNTATYRFSILKPWYATNLAKVIYVVLILLTFYTIYKYLKFRWHVKTQLQLEHAETERLKKLDEFKTKLYTNISHEFRTPLTLISGPIDKQLDREDLSEKDKKDMSLVKQNANRLLKLVNQMIDLSLVDSGQLNLKVDKGNLGVLLKLIVAAFQYMAEEKHLKIEANITKIDNAYFDKDIIEKIASNLLSNAIKYSPKGSPIFVQANAQNKSLVLSIVNSYQYVGKKDLSKLFQRFYQDDEAAEGIGVGLALVKELITLGKGTIVANNIAENQIQFNVTLPINKNAFEDSELIQAQAKVVESIQEVNEQTNNRFKVLIVEDQNDILEFIVSIFKDDYEVIKAKNGQIGVEKAEKHLPDIIISDIMMPIKDGIALCNEIKHSDYTNHIPIILLTAKVGESNEIEGLKTGADAYITKPFSSKLLMTHVEQLLTSRKQLKVHYSKEFTIAPELAITSTETEFLNRLKDVLETHITDTSFKSEDLSKYMYLSRTQLHRKLKAIYGLSTSEFIRSQRVKLATKLLNESDATVSEIAYQVGFNSSSYFIKSFKEHYQLTPSDYQKHQ